MNKSELIDALAASCNVTKTVASGMLESFTNIITGQLQSGDEVAVTGFGSFSIGERSARKGRNPRTGEEITIDASRVVKFKAGKALKDAVQKD